MIMPLRGVGITDGGWQEIPVCSLKPALSCRSRGDNQITELMGCSVIALNRKTHSWKTLIFGSLRKRTAGFGMVEEEIFKKKKSKRKTKVKEKIKISLQTECPINFRFRMLIRTRKYLNTVTLGVAFPQNPDEISKYDHIYIYIYIIKAWKSQGICSCCISSSQWVIRSRAMHAPLRCYKVCLKFSPSINP